MERALNWNIPFAEQLFCENPHWDAETKNAYARLRRGAPLLHDHLFVATSGSTAQRGYGLKLIALSREAMIASARAVNTHLGVTPEDRWLKALPSYHVGGLGVLARAALIGNEVDELSSWSAREFVRVVTERGSTLTSLVPSQVFDIVAAGVKSPRSMRAIVIGGAALSPDLYQRARALGWPLLPSFGMTETCSQIATASLDSLTREHTALPPLTILSHVECRADAEGILAVRGASLLSCEIIEDSAGVQCNDPKRGGWFTTTDRALVPGDGTLVPLGRKDEVVKILGEQVHLQRIRDEWDRVARESGASDIESVVLDIPDERRGRTLVAVVAGELTNALSARMDLLVTTFNRDRTPVERIARWINVRTIPRTELLKVRWRVLRELVAEL